MELNQELSQRLKKTYPDHSSLSLTKKEMGRLEQLKLKYRNKENIVVDKKRQQVTQKEQKYCQKQFRLNNIALSPQSKLSQKQNNNQIHGFINVNLIELLKQAKHEPINRNNIVVSSNRINTENNFESGKLLIQNQIHQFKGKVFKVNNSIQSHLDYLEEKLKQLKNQKKTFDQEEMTFKVRQYNKQQSQKKKYSEQFFKQSQSRKIFDAISSPTSFRQKLQQSEQKTQRSNLAQYAKLLVQSQIIEIKEQKRYKPQYNDYSDQIIQVSQNFLEPLQEIIGQTRLKIDLIQLKGNFKRKIPAEFITFINRLSHQIKIDSVFTTKLINCKNIEVFDGKQTKNLLNAIKLKVKLMTSHYPIAFQDGLLQVNQLQLDPLQPSQIQRKNMSAQQILNQTTKIRDEYIMVQQFYYRKLHKKFKPQIISILIDQLKQIHSIPQNAINIGHMTSYINMRTECEYRNRNLYKLLKRMKISGGYLQIDKIRSSLS